MKTIYSPRHAGHAGNVELMTGKIMPAFEMPSRAEFIRSRAEEVGLGPILPPEEFDLDTARRVHDPAYVDFMPTVWERWTAAGFGGTALPYTWPTRGLRGDVVPDVIEAQLGYYSFDAGAGFVEGTWDAIKSSHDVALTAASLVSGGERSAFALCRPPGHHAGRAFMGGYCYLNNASIAARWLIDNGARKVSILDVDYHHGNGEGEGEGFNHNYPLPWGTGWDGWGAALVDACLKLVAYGPDVVVVSLGVDTFERDPISKFKLTTEDYPKIGRRIEALGLPTLFVMEGGYAVEEIGVNAVGVLTGFEEGNN